MSGGFIDPDKPLRDLYRAHRALEARVAAVERALPTSSEPTDAPLGDHAPTDDGGDACGANESEGRL